jgi:hypothetical protein
MLGRSLGCCAVSHDSLDEIQTRLGNPDASSTQTEPCGSGEGPPAGWDRNRCTGDVVLTAPNVALDTASDQEIGRNILSASSASWRELLANPGPAGHIVQLYNDADFYGEAISHFAAEGFLRGESLIIVPTQPNWANISARLKSKGADPTEHIGRGQLTVLDADATLPRFLVDGMPDGRTFKDLAAATIERALGGGKFSRVRWWGEMVNVLYENGNQRASIRLEELFDEVAREQSIPILCSFLMDKYDPKIYEHDLGDVWRTHRQVIAAEDYTLHRAVVDRAVGDVLGPIEGPLLKSLVAWARTRSPRMPSSQSTLLWVRDAVPAKFDEVLACARKYEREILDARRR